MPYEERITLIKVDGSIRVFYENPWNINYDKVEYVVGDDIPKEDIEGSYIGALKHFFNESEVWNG